ncbi:hypothetical protein LshimejAT787_1600170 [Lyophyllum shimeji]|uniref:Uncharacterized protein n=1 Tax=Lyophyllum shimeji TaxID=47721 RepID=A0A9P3PZH8_LYOSH|nr:hypothetical protein LshimejAT787_1600170 [Lyophyllum shimeji]
MGRRAIHLSLADRQAAAKEKQHERRDSTHSKDLIQVQRYTAYWKKNGRQGSSKPSQPVVIDSSPPKLATIPHLQTPGTSLRSRGSATQPPPAELVTMALLPMPEASSFFQQASRSADLLDETGLKIWDAGPPYLSGPSSDTLRELEFIRRLEEVMHGRRTRLLRECEVTRASLPPSVVQEALVQAVGK